MKYLIEGEILLMFLVTMKYTIGLNTKPLAG